MKIELKNAKNDTTRCEILRNLIDNDYNTKIWPIYNEELSKLSKKHIADGNFTNSKNIFIKYYAYAVSAKGLDAQERGNITKALEFYFTSLKIQEQSGFKAEMAGNYSNIAYIYSHQGDINSGIKFMQKALKLQQENVDTNGIAESLNNLGTLYKQVLQISKAEEYLNLSLELNKKINNKNGLVNCLTNLGGVYMAKHELEKSISYFLQALKLCKEINDENGMSNILTNMANIMLRLGKMDKAIKYGEQSYNLAIDLNYIENIRDASNVLFKIYKKQNNNKGALEMYEKYILFRDSISSETTRKSSIKSQLKYEYEKKAAADSVLVAEEKKLSNVKFKHEQNQRYFLYGGLGLTILFGIFMFNRFRITQKQKVLIQQQKLIVEKQKHIVEEKQKEVLDSIRYAKRIQQSLLPTEKYIERILKK